MKILQKLSSRKLWTAILGIAAGLGMAFGLDEGAIGTVAGAVLSLVSTITYIVTEGKIDAAAVGNTAQKIQDAADGIASVKDEQQ